jgi:3-oxoacyl-[acyl-carrier protein] reductase
MIILLAMFGVSELPDIRTRPLRLFSVRSSCDRADIGRVQMDLGLSGKVAFVTGGSEGIGEGIALELAKEGASVAVCARREGPLANLAAKLDVFGRPYLAVPADCTSQAQMNDIVDLIAAKLGKIDILINNAGGGATGVRSLEDPDELWLSCYDLNVWSTVRTTRAVFPHFRERRAGSIVIISSVGGHSGGMLGVADYNSAKAAQLLLTKSWAYDFAPHGVRVNAINPAFIHTPLWDKLAEAFIPGEGETTESFFERTASTLPVRRMGTAADVGRVAAFLASNTAASFITGACWDVDGGFTTKI